MSSTELEVIRAAEQRDLVVSLAARRTPISSIVKQTGLNKREVEAMLIEYKEYAQQDRVLREMARETLITTRQHYDDLIQQMYEVIKEAEASGDYKSHMQGVKIIADIENQRVNFMQKAGMLADNEIGQQLVEYEHKQKLIVDLLKDVAKTYPDAGLMIQTRLKEVTGKLEGVPSERVDK